MVWSSWPHRIEGCIPTIKELSDKGAKLVILAHQGSDIEYQRYDTLESHAHVIRELTGKYVEFVPDVCGPFAQERNADLVESMFFTPFSSAQEAHDNHTFPAWKRRKCDCHALWRLNASGSYASLKTLVYFCNV